ncbi:ComEC/Rec2 family competence protein [Microbacterium hominis]|uniref:ComEC/Rec2 family competence protein n=1 Tax=Microbacterium hominis TaxID=162426 RepID=UPI001964EFDE|nr:ComEC/Rec2 family competence protein [Microbacterium hominis]QRY41060.1 ComEC/Rec2 family competence protein [Microbacterium hominis]
MRVGARTERAIGGRRLRRRDARLVPVAAAAWLVAGLLTAQAEVSGVVATALWAASTAVLLCAVRRGRAAPACALIAVALAASGAVAMQVAAAQPTRAVVAAADTTGGRALSVMATAVGKIERSATGWRFDAILERLEYGDTVISAAAPVLVRTAEVPTGLDLGARVRLRGTGWRPEAGDRAVLVIDAASVPTLLSGPTGALSVASELRRGLVEVTAGLPDPGRGLIAGLAVGDTSTVDPGLDTAMKASSLSHLTAVSGANCALVVGMAFGGAAVCGARRGIRVGAGLAALVAFVVLVSPEPSVVRAATMAAVAMLGVLLGRTGAGLSLLAVSVAVLVIMDPWLARSLGFALSVTATAALLVVAGPLADGLARWMPHPLALALSVPLAAQLACTPLIVLISPQVSLYGVLANVLAAPAAPLGTVLGLAACVCAGIPALGAGMAVLAWLPAAWIAATATVVAQLPGSAVWWPQGPVGLLALAVVGLAVGLLLVRTRRVWRIASLLVLAVTAAVALGVGPVAEIGERARIPSDWTIAACDVGQGDALVVRSTAHVALVDTGPDPAALERCLRTLGVDRIELLVLTHFDHDHDGGVAAVVGRVDVVVHGPTGTPDDERTLRRLAEGGARPIRATAGMTGLLGDARWRVRGPESNAAAGNDASVVIEVTGPGVPPTLMLGDLSADAQRRLAATAPLLTSYAVVKVSHHGSADQDARLYARLRPALAIVSVGANTYGHPRAETLTMLSGLGARIDRTDTEGLIVLWSEESALRVWRERSPP